MRTSDSPGNAEIAEVTEIKTQALRMAHAARHHLGHDYDVASTTKFVDDVMTTWIQRGMTKKCIDGETKGAITRQLRMVHRDHCKIAAFFARLSDLARDLRSEQATLEEEVVAIDTLLSTDFADRLMWKWYESNLTKIFRAPPFRQVILLARDLET